MLTKKIKAEDFEGNLREETFYFNLSKSELTKMELSINGGLSSLLQRIAETQDIKEVKNLLEQFIDMSYGVKSLDGRKFEKSEEALKDFKSTNFYDELFMELISDANKAADFINAVVPSDVSQKALELQQNGGNLSASANPNHPALKH